MYCSNCGKQLNDNVNFCKHCGYTITEERQEKNIINHESDNTQLNTVFNRDVLNNYLYNVRTLEFYNNKLLNQKNYLENRISQLGIKQVSENGADKIKIEDMGFLLGIGVILIIAGMIVGYLKYTWIADFLFDITGFLNGLSIFAIVIGILIIAGSIIYLIVSNKIIESEYKESLANDNKRVNSELVERNNLCYQLDQLVEEINKTENLRIDAYSLNIIPSKFRNIYASYFLYDFISTSTASLNEALLHCDLDTIQQQLATIIQQQSEIILQQVKANALNEKIVSQNEQILNNAIQAEKNTALTAQYAKISAMNTSVTASIQMSEYLRP